MQPARCRVLLTTGQEARREDWSVLDKMMKGVGEEGEGEGEGEGRGRDRR